MLIWTLIFLTFFLSFFHPSLLYILTRMWVLPTPSESLNMLFQRFLHGKAKKGKKIEAKFCKKCFKDFFNQLLVEGFIPRKKTHYFQLLEGELTYLNNPTICDEPTTFLGWRFDTLCLPQFFALSSLFCTKNVGKEYFDQCLECAAPKC